jgi:hypothetical protein
MVKPIHDYKKDIGGFGGSLTRKPPLSYRY